MSFQDLSNVVLDVMPTVVVGLLFASMSVEVYPWLVKTTYRGLDWASARLPRRGR